MSGLSPSLPPSLRAGAVPHTSGVPASVTAAVSLPRLTRIRPESPGYVAMARVDASGRVQDRAVVTSLGWRPGDRLLVTVVATSAVIARRAEGVVTMPGKPYVVVSAAVRARCGITGGSRVLLVADPGQDVLVVHPESVVHAMLRCLHADLGGGERV